MTIKVYVSGISGNHEIRKQQQRVLFILSSLKVDFVVIDITEMGNENQREFMRTQCRLHNKPNPLPPQVFNEDDYCGDYEDFETANEENELMPFLKLGSGKIPHGGNGVCEDSKETSQILSNVETGESEAFKDHILQLLLNPPRQAPVGESVPPGQELGSANAPTGQA